jgi:hypothetical protein
VKVELFSEMASYDLVVLVTNTSLKLTMTVAQERKRATSKKPQQSFFKHWHERSWIRSKPMRKGPISGLPFSPDLVPLSTHPAISSDQQKWMSVLGYRLLAHLQFTTLLELNHVNPICSALAQGRAPISLTTEQRHDALKIYCDEGAHALFVETFSSQVEEHFGLNRAVIGRPNFDRVIEKIVSENATRLSPNLIRLFFVSISETLVTKVLKNVPHDPEVAPIVRAVIGDHADDEALHSAYFHNLFLQLWQNLATYEKEEMIQLLPQLVWAFLGPDHQFDYSVLRRLGFNAKDAEGILQEVYIPQEVGQGVRQAASPTLNMFEAAGIFDMPFAEHVFADAQLIQQ